MSNNTASTAIWDNIPDELKSLRQWVCYRIEERDGKPTKIPYRTDKVGRGNAKSNDPSTWHTFDEVMEAVAKPKNRFDGIGFILSASDPYVFIDLDHVVENGELEPWARDLIERVGSYTEFSQSGSGIHIIARAKKPGTRCRTHEKPKFEIYDNLRLVVFTGKLFPGTSADIQDAQTVVDKIYFEVFRDNPRNVPPKERAKNALPFGMSDPVLIKEALAAKNGPKFERLWVGNTGEYNGDASAADMALCCILAYWTDKDPARMDRLFRESGLMRGKWDESRGSQTYGQMTIDAAIDMTRETYADHAMSSPRSRICNKRPMDDVPRVLYRLPRVLQTIRKELPVLVVEEEKDVHTLERIGFVATCNPGGDGKWLPEYSDALRGGNIIIIADNDDPGRLHAEMVARSLSGIAARIRVLHLPDLKEHGDITDWIAAGGTKDRLIEIAKACPDWSPSPEYDQAFAERNNRGRADLSANHTLSPEDEARAVETIETAIVVGTAAAIYGDECVTSLAILSEGKRADLIQKISASIKAVCKRDIKKKVAAKLLELSPLTVAYIAPEGQLGQLLSPNIPIKESCEAAISSLVEHNDPMRLFMRGGRMSRIRPNDQGTMKIEELAKEGIAYELNSLIDFYYVNPKDG